MWYGMWKYDLLGESSRFSSVSESIKEIFTTNNHGLYLLELPTESYCEMNFCTIKHLIDNGFKGVYVSFQRPLENIDSMLKELEIDNSQIKILDGTNETKNNKNKGELLPKDVNKIFDKILYSLENLEGNKKFVFIDSITTMALINSEPWSDKFSKYLVTLKDQVNFEDIVFIVNSPKDLSNKKIVKNISSSADMVLNISFIKGYSVEVIKQNILT